MPETRKCSIFVKPRHGLARTCIQDAICHITYFTDGSGGQYACAHHRDAALVLVASMPNVPMGAPLRYTPLGPALSRIETARDQRRKEQESS